MYMGGLIDKLWRLVELYSGVVFVALAGCGV
jgi:hypothetical protein